MNIKFEFNSSTSFSIEDLANDFLNNGFNQIFSNEKLPSGYSASKSNLDAILLVSTCNNCQQRPTTTPSSFLTTTTTTSLSDRVRLPGNIVPTNYKLRLNAFFKPETNQPDDTVQTNYYNGQVDILFEVKNSTKSILFHADTNLQIKSVKLFSEYYHIPGEIQLPSNYLTRLEYQLVKISLANEITIGKYLLSIDFSSDYGPSSNLVGFYRTQYTENGIT